MTAPLLVAHRGWPSRYPENTLIGIEAALDRGARAVEIDVQFSADGVPVLFHDRDLARCAGREGAVGDFDLSALAAIGVGEPARFGDRFAAARIPALAEVVAPFAARADAWLLVEIKRAGLERMGVDGALAAVLPLLAPLAGRATLISFDRALVAELLRRGTGDCGFILQAADDAALTDARALGAPLLFANVTKLPAGDAPLPAGPWRWAVYAVNDAAAAMDWAARGAALVETDAIGELLDDPELAAWGGR